MSPKAEQLLNEVRDLPDAERHAVTEALDRQAEEDDFIPDDEKELAEQIQRRLDEIDSGMVKMIPGEQVLTEIRERLKEAGRDV